MYCSTGLPLDEIADALPEYARLAAHALAMGVDSQTHSVCDFGVEIEVAPVGTAISLTRARSCRGVEIAFQNARRTGLARERPFQIDARLQCIRQREGGIEVGIAALEILCVECGFIRCGGRKHIDDFARVHAHEIAAQACIQTPAC